MKIRLVKNGIMCLAVLVTIVTLGIPDAAWGSGSGLGGGTPPIVSAAYDNDLEKVRALVQQGVDVNARRDRGSIDALGWAVTRNHLEMTRMLLAAGADAKRMDVRLFYHAVEKNSLEVLRLVVAAGACTNKKRCNGLHTAAGLNNIEVVKMLLAAGADLKTSYALGEAANSGHLEMVKFLVAKGANDLDTALWQADRSGDMGAKIMQFLIEQGADVNTVESTDGYGNKTPLLRATYSGCYSCVKVLVANGADVNVAKESGGTALINAAGLGGEEGLKILKLLLDNGADPHARNQHGKDAEARIDERALHYEIKKAATGDAFAQYKLFGKYSRYPRAIIRQAKVDMWAGKAHDSFRTLAGKGDAKGQYYLGFMEFYGQGVKADTARGLAWMTKAAEAGNVDAQRHLGVIYSKGSQGVAPDKAAAIRWYEMAAAQGSTSSKEALKKLRE